jgi:hypothetical protein
MLRHSSLSLAFLSQHSKMNHRTINYAFRYKDTYMSHENREIHFDNSFFKYIFPIFRDSFRQTWLIPRDLPVVFLPFLKNIRLAYLYQASSNKLHRISATAVQWRQSGISADSDVSKRTSRHLSVLSARKLPADRRRNLILRAALNQALSSNRVSSFLRNDGLKTKWFSSSTVEQDKCSTVQQCTALSFKCVRTITI